MKKYIVMTLLAIVAARLEAPRKIGVRELAGLGVKILDFKKQPALQAALFRATREYDYRVLRFKNKPTLEAVLSWVTEEYAYATRIKNALEKTRNFFSATPQEANHRKAVIEFLTQELQKIGYYDVFEKYNWSPE